MFKGNVCFVSISEGYSNNYDVGKMSIHLSTRHRLQRYYNCLYIPTMWSNPKLTSWVTPQVHTANQTKMLKDYQRKLVNRQKMYGIDFIIYKRFLV